MFRYIIPTILIALAIAAFFMFTDPMYQEITSKRQIVDSYNQALDNSKALESERDKLTQKYNSFDPNNLARLQKLLPNNVDNIRLILEIENIASPYGMLLKNVKYDTTNGKSDTVSSIVPTTGNPSPKDYGVWDLEFSTQGTYNNFVNFLKDLENNLRIVDVSSIQFSSNIGLGLNPSLSQSYKYDFRVKTYWLKN